MRYYNNYGFRPYVSVAQRRRNAQRQVAKLAKKGKVIQPVQIEGRTIARSFWGKAWCDNLESYSDYENRLPRGRTYVRNGSVEHLDVCPGKLEAMVSGSELYRVKIDITPAARQLLGDLDHPFARGEAVYDTTFENVQAGLRTDYLFRIANHRNGIVLGTGDLSELALGWCTYGVGDQMSHYGVNAGVPKTLIQHLIRWVITAGEFGPEVAGTLRAILDTEITPELVPVADGQTPQSTEAAVGPFALQDFTLYHVLRHGFRPSKIAFLAGHAWGDTDRGAWPPGFPTERRVAYRLSEIRRWMEVFLQRFFAFSQFKRSALPNGPKVVAGGALSPRGDWRAPSDATARVWLEELRREVPEQE